MTLGSVCSSNDVNFHTLVQAVKKLMHVKMLTLKCSFVKTASYSNCLLIIKKVGSRSHADCSTPTRSATLVKTLKSTKFLFNLVHGSDNKFRDSFL